MPNKRGSKYIRLKKVIKGQKSQIHNDSWSSLSAMDRVNRQKI